MNIFKIGALVVFAVCIMGSVSCSSKGESTVDKLAFAVDDVIKIVKVNSKDPKAAAVAINKYLVVNEKKLTSLRKSLDDSALVRKSPKELDAEMKKLEPLVIKGMELQRLSVALKTNAEFTKAMTSFNAAALGK